MKIDRPALRRRIVRARAASWAILALALPWSLSLAPGLGLVAAAEMSEYRWSAAVQSPEIDRATLEAISLDSAIFAAARPDLADLRLRGRDGQPVAFVVRQVPTTRQRPVVKSWPATERGAKPIAPDGLEIFIDPPADQVGPLDGISVSTPLRDFEQQVRVFSSPDGQDWQPVSPPTVIFDYSRLVDVRSVNVPISRTTDRHFRLVIDNVTAEQAARLLELSRHFQGTKEVDRTDRTTIDRRPFRVDRLSFYRNEVETETTGLQTIRYPATDFRATQDVKQKQTVLTFNCRHEPLTSVRLLTDETNFSRSASLQIPVGGGAAEESRARWRTVAAATLARFSFETLKRNDMSLACPEQRSDRYRVVVENRDSPPVSFSGVEVEGPEYQLVFLAEPGQSLTLDYGWPDAPVSSYDTAAIRASLAAGYSPNRVEFAEPVENLSAAKPSGWKLSAFLADAWVVASLVAGLCLLLGWALYRAARRIDGTPGA